MFEPFPTGEFGFVLAVDVRAVGREAELYAAVRSGTLERVRRGVFRHPPPSEADPLRRSETRFGISRSCAAGLSMGHAVFTSYSAIALAGLPIVGVAAARRRDVERRERSPPRRRDPHRPNRRDLDDLDGRTPDHDDRVQPHPFARRAPLATALVATDASSASRRTGAPPLTTLGALRAEHERVLPYQSRRVDAVLTGDIRRRHAARDHEPNGHRGVRFPEPVLQHWRWFRISVEARTDFFWPDHEVAAEADGRGKYLGNGVLESIDAVLAEKTPGRTRSVHR